jgi:hypothetical protein
MAPPPTSLVILTVTVTVTVSVILTVTVTVSVILTVTVTGNLFECPQNLGWGYGYGRSCLENDETEASRSRSRSRYLIFSQPNQPKLICSLVDGFEDVCWGTKWPLAEASAFLPTCSKCRFCGPGTKQPGSEG